MEPIVSVEEMRRIDAESSEDIDRLMDAAGLVGSSWEPWRSFWRAVFSLPMTEKDREVFRRHTARRENMPVPSHPLVLGEDLLHDARNRRRSGLGPHETELAPTTSGRCCPGRPRTP